MGLSDGERNSMIRSAVLIQYTRVTDRRTDRRMELAWHIRAIAYMLSRVKMMKVFTKYEFRLLGVRNRYNSLIWRTSHAVCQHAQHAQLL